MKFLTWRFWLAIAILALIVFATWMWISKQTTLKSGAPKTLGRLAFESPFADRPSFQEVSDE
jgi:hypothetical protein